MTTQLLTITGEVTMPNGASLSFTLETDVPSDVTEGDALDTLARTILTDFCTNLASEDEQEPYQPIATLSN